MKAKQHQNLYWILGFAALCVGLFAFAPIDPPAKYVQVSIFTFLIAIIVSTYWMPKTTGKVIGLCAVITGFGLAIFSNDIFGGQASMALTSCMFSSAWYLVTQLRKPTPSPADQTADVQPPT